MHAPSNFILSTAGGNSYLNYPNEGPKTGDYLSRPFNIHRLFPSLAFRSMDIAIDLRLLTEANPETDKFREAWNKMILIAAFLSKLSQCHGGFHLAVPSLFIIKLSWQHEIPCENRYCRFMISLVYLRFQTFPSSCQTLLRTTISYRPYL